MYLIQILPKQQVHLHCIQTLNSDTRHAVVHTLTQSVYKPPPSLFVSGVLGQIFFPSDCSDSHREGLITNGPAYRNVRWIFFSPVSD